MATTSTSSKKLTYYVYKSGNNTDPIRRALNNRGWESVDVDEAKANDYWFANFIWKPTWTNPKPCTSLFARQHSNASKRQVYNHLKAVEPLCTKDSLFETMRTYYATAGEEPFKHLPPTFLVEPKLGEVDNWPGWSDFIQHFNKCANDASVKRNLWLVKPTSANRGIGIEVFSSVTEIKSFLETKARGAAMGIAPVWVLQKYIENPLLYKGRKFDLRVWVLALDNGDIYIHAPGYVRTSSEVFDLESTNRYAHLTNYCQQVNAESFGKFEEGNTLTFNDLENYLTEILKKRNGGGGNTAVSSGDTSKDKPVHEATNGIEVMWGCGKNGLWGQMRSAVIDTFEALRGRGGSRSCGYEENGYARKPGPGIAVPTGKGGITSETSVANRTTGPSGSRHRFELLGFDFMIDSDFKIHFIEVNTNPSLSYQNDWHEGFVDDMAERLLDVVFADAFPELGTAPDEACIAGSPMLDNKRPEWSWQWIMNTYSSPLRHAATASVQAAADAFRSTRNTTKTTATSGSSSSASTSLPNTSTNASGVSASTVNRTINLAASKFLGNKNKSKDGTASTIPKEITKTVAAASASKTADTISPSSESKDSNEAFLSTVTSVDPTNEPPTSMDDESKESDEDNGRLSGAENIDSSRMINGNRNGIDSSGTGITSTLSSSSTSTNVATGNSNRSVSVSRMGGKRDSIGIRSNNKRDTEDNNSSSSNRSTSAMKGSSVSRLMNTKVPANRVAAVFRSSSTNDTPPLLSGTMNDGTTNGSGTGLSIIGTPATTGNDTNGSSNSTSNEGIGNNPNHLSSRLRMNPNITELGITGAGLMKTIVPSSSSNNNPHYRSSSVSRSTPLPSSSSSLAVGNYVMPNGSVLDVSAIDTDGLLGLMGTSSSGSSSSPTGTTRSSSTTNDFSSSIIQQPPVSPIRVGR